MEIWYIVYQPLFVMDNPYGIREINSLGRCRFYQKGREEAREAGEKLKEYHFNEAYTSENL